MNIKRLVVLAVTAFSATAIVCAVVTLLWNLTAHGAAIVDWETSFRFAIVLGIILPLMETQRSKEK
jgi:hypothetical protein